MDFDLRIFEQVDKLDNERLSRVKMSKKDREKIEAAKGWIVREGKEYLSKNDVLGAMMLLGNTNHMTFVFDNILQLKEVGKYEESLFCAFTSTRTNHAGWSLDVIHFLFANADREKLISAGDPIPGGPPYIIYRGVSGNGAKRRLRGFSWSASFDKAKWFAERFKDLGLNNPAVFMATVGREHIFAYYNGRNEQEFICDIPKGMKLKKVWP